MKSWEDFKSRWVIDYEFISGKGNRQLPICYVAQNIDTGEIIRHWITGSETKPEYPLGVSSLLIAYYASAEMGCHIPLHFPFPVYLLDLFAEFRCLTNGVRVPSGNSLIGACTYYGLSSSDVTYKDSMRDRILQGKPFSKEEIKDILTYCQKDVEMTARLFFRMEKDIDLPYALLRGRYMTAIANMEYNGIPIDVKKLNILKKNWDFIKEKLISQVDKKYGVYEGTTFKMDKFTEYLHANKIPWEYSEMGLPVTRETFFKEQAKMYPQLKPLQELRYSLGQLKLNKLQVGEDGRNRTLLSPFASKTSRNYPSTNKYIFGNAVWLRSLIKPTRGIAISYIDFEQQEIAIAAALSGDENLKSAYLSGDPYLAFAKSVGAIPTEGTKVSHPEEREKFKQLMLALNYGMSIGAFARKTNIPFSEAKTMVQAHKQRFSRYWEWIINFVDLGILFGKIKTNYNWYFQTVNAESRTLMNWPMQSHGADILRLAICLCLEHGVKVIAPVHDAILIEAPISDIDLKVKTAQQCMEDASEYVIGFRIRTEAKTICYPERFTDKRGKIMWNAIWECIAELNGSKKVNI